MVIYNIDQLNDILMFKPPKYYDFSKYSPGMMSIAEYVFHSFDSYMPACGLLDGFANFSVPTFSNNTQALVILTDVPILKF